MYRELDGASRAARRVVVLLAALMAVLAAVVAVGAPRASAAVEENTLSFDDLPVGTVVTNQYEAKGAVFGFPEALGFSYDTAGQGTTLVRCGSVRVAKSPITETPPNYAITSCEEGEGFRARPGMFAKLPRTAKRVKVYVGDPVEFFQSEEEQSTDTWRMDVYGIGRELLASKETVETIPAITTPLEIEAPEYEIAYVAVYIERQTPITRPYSLTAGIDDLSLKTGGAPATVAVAPIAHQYLAQSGTVQQRVTVERFNESKGRVKLGIEGLPPGVVAHFSPETLQGTETTSTLTLSAERYASPGETAGIRVSAKPEEKPAGTTPAHASFTLSLTPEFEVIVSNGLGELEDNVNLQPCASAQRFVGLRPGVGISRPLTEPLLELLAVGSPPDLSATLRETSPGAGQVTLARNERAGSGPYSVYVSGYSAGLREQAEPLEVHRSPPTLSSVSPENVTIPHAVFPGATVRLRGSGFCPGTTVTFGNPSAVAQTTYVNPAELVAQVPSLATSGPVTISSGGQTASAGSVKVVAYRPQDGFSWPNKKGPTVTFEDLEKVYGYENTHAHIDPCAWGTFGLVSCSVATTSAPSAEAAVFLKQIENYGQNGICWGMDLASLRLSGRAPGGPPLSEFAPAGAQDTWQLAETPSLVDYATQMHIVQAGNEVQGARKQAQQEAEGQSTAGLLGRLRSLLQSEGEAIIDIWKEGKGHSLVALDVEGEAGGAFKIWTYNPNVPFAKGELGNTEAAGKLHQTNEEESAIKVSAGGSWSFKELGWQGPLAKLDVLPLSSIPQQPTYNNNFINPVISFSASGSASVAQVSDAAGRTLLSGSGEPNKSSSAIPGAVVLPPLEENSGPSALLKPGRAYTLTLTPHGSGPFDASLVGAGLDAQVAGAQPASAMPVAGRASAGGSPAGTKLTFDNATSSLGVAGGPPRAPLDTSLLTRAGDGSQRVADVRGAARGYTLSFDRSRNSVSLVQGSAPAALSLQLGWSGSEGLPGAFTMPTLVLARGERLTLTPSNWHALGRASVLAVLHSRSGRTRRLRLVGRTTSPVSLRAPRLSVAGSRAHPRLLLRVPTHGSAPGAEATIVWAVVRGRRVVRAHSQTVSLAALSRTLAWQPSHLQRGRYSLLAAVAVLATRPPSPVLTAVTRRTRIAFSVR